MPMPTVWTSRTDSDRNAGAHPEAPRVHRGSRLRRFHRDRRTTGGRAWDRPCPCQPSGHQERIQIGTLVRTLKRLGFTVAVVSGGFIEIVGPLAAELGIDHAHANRLDIKNGFLRSEEHTSELQPLRHLVCSLLLEK